MPPRSAAGNSPNTISRARWAGAATPEPVLRRAKPGPGDNAKAESLMKTLKMEEFYLTEHKTFGEVATGLPRFIEGVYNATRLHSVLGYRSPVKFEEEHARQMVQ